MVNGMSYDVDSETVKEGEACVRGKMKKETFPKHSEHTVEPPDHTKLYTVTYVDPCKLNQRVVADTC